MAAATAAFVAAPASPQATSEEPAAPETRAAPARGVKRAPALREAVEIRRNANQATRASQTRIETLSDETDALYARATAAERQLEALSIYNRSMREVVAEQEAELAALGSQLEQMDEVGRSVTPLMQRKIETLERFVDLDIPFLPDERAQRIASLRRLMSRADVSVSEKYRLIMEAYRIETDYGRTIEAYRGPLQPAGDGRTVDFLRFGRIALLYLTLDEKEAGVWDAESRSWRVLPASVVREVRHGIRVARKQVAPDLVKLPLPAPQASGAKAGG